MDSGERTPDRALVGVLIAIGAIVAIALVVVLTRNAPAHLDPDSAEGVVQRYATAVLGGDDAAARDLLSPEAKAGCDSSVAPWTDNVRLSLVSTVIDGDTADVRVSITTSYGGGIFGESESSEDGAFHLVRPGSAWLVDSAPWQFTICPQ